MISKKRRGSWRRDAALRERGQDSGRRAKKPDKVKLRAGACLRARASVSLSPRNLQTLVRGPPTVTAALPPRTLRQLARLPAGRGAAERRQGGTEGGRKEGRRSFSVLEVAEEEEEEEERVVLSQGVRARGRGVSRHGRSQAGSPRAAAQTRFRPRSAEEGRQIHQVGRGEISLFVCG